ncbi:MAG: hypothetical protein IKM76_00025 [Prevotella sp.]|nr:hypothetical protein [Prevotella sp.]
MKKLLLFAFGAMMSMASYAQEDVTHYIQNAGFDEDLTWQADGSMKEAQTTNTSLSDRSWAYIAADSTVYAKPKSTSSQQRKDGRSKLDATNGFIGRIQGWTIETNQDFPKCEWVYFGSVPYSLADQAIPIADDGDTYLLAPSKPDVYSGDDNIGFAYLRAGWGGRAVYKQVVKLPCAVYRLEYWAINNNPSGTNGKNLSKVVCRKDTWEDETGFSDTEWTLHTIEFTPTSEFTMQFGFESSGGSGSNPFLCIDGIKLYKIDEADPVDLLRSDFQDAVAECEELAGKASGENFMGLSGYLSDYAMDIDDLSGSTDQAELEASLKEVNARMVEIRNAMAELANLNAALTRMDDLLQNTSMPGKAELEAAYQKILNYKEKDPEEGADIIAQIMGAVAESEDAIKAYYLSQVSTASAENPADLTIFIQHPWFIETSAEPTLTDEAWVFPNEINEETGESNYTEGSASSPDLNSTGWYLAGASGGDQRLNWQRGRSCWNAWNSGFTTTVAVAQDIEGLPNGYYTVSADLITQSGYANGTQRVFAKSIAETKTSTKALEGEGWDYNEWETVAMSADDKVLVVDGKLTIGAQGTGDGNASAGWFLATNFHLYYLGEAPAEAVKGAFDAKVAAANEMAGQIKFKADQKALNDSIAKFGAMTEYIEALNGLTAAMTEGQKSLDKYEEYIPEDGTIEGKTIPTVQATLKENGGDGYGEAEDIVKFAYDHVVNWVKNDTASYVDFDAQVNLLKNYLNTYTPVYNNAAATAQTAAEKGKAAIENLMAAQKAELISEMKDLNTINTFVEALNDVVALADKQSIVDDPNATDYTAFIKNPKLEAETGWTFDKGNGNNNTAGGQWLDGSSTRYIDSYNGSGLQGYIAQQLITGLPNGTYTVGVYTRTPAEGAYIFNAPGDVKTFVEIPLDYYMGINEEGEEVQMIASDTHGPIWEAAKAAVESGDYTDEQYTIYNTNVVEGEGIGRGWKHQEMTGIVVTNHQLLIGTCAGSEALQTEKVFAGNWYSVGGWTLTLIEKGDNTGWDGPVADGIADVKTATTVADGVYTISGVKQAKMQRGLNIIVRGGKAQKVIVK